MFFFVVVAILHQQLPIHFLQKAPNFVNLAISSTLFLSMAASCALEQKINLLLQPRIPQYMQPWKVIDGLKINIATISFTQYVLLTNHVILP